MDDLRLAWRNVWRNTRRSVVTISATAFALFVMIVYSGLVAGYTKGMERNLLNLEVGDIQVFADGYREKPSIYTSITDAEAFVAALEDAGYQASPRLLATGLGAGDDNSSGVQLIGIDVAADRDVSQIFDHVQTGTWLEPEDEGVVIGWRLAETLALDVGDELLVLTQGGDGSMANDVYPVRGILKGISDGVDRGGVFMTHANWRELMVLDEGVHQIIVRTPKGAQLEQATDKAQGFAPEGAKVQSWKQIQPMLASMLQSTDGSMVMMTVIVYLAVGIVILNAMLMAVFERVREFGVLKAIGFGPGKIFKLIMLETSIQTSTAMVVGVLLAIPANYYMANTGLDLSALGNVSIMGLAWDPIWRSEVTVETYTTPVVLLMVIVGLAVLYPALRAAFIKPLDAIRSA